MIEVKESRDCGCIGCFDKKRGGGTKPAYEITMWNQNKTQGTGINLCADCVKKIHLKVKGIEMGMIPMYHI